MSVISHGLPQEFEELKFRTYIITTNEARARCEMTLEELTKYPILGQPVVLTSERDLENTRRGCWNAHLRAVNEIYEEGLDFGFIFEDDVEWKGDALVGITNALQFTAARIKSGAPLDAVYLGHLALGRCTEVGAEGKIVHCAKSALMHAYIAGPDWVRTIRSTRFCGHVDMVLANQPHVYAVKPMVAFQRDLLHSNYTKWIDRLAIRLRGWVGMRNLCRLLEILSRWNPLQ